MTAWTSTLGSGPGFNLTFNLIFNLGKSPRFRGGEQGSIHDVEKRVLLAVY